MIDFRAEDRRLAVQDACADLALLAIEDGSDAPLAAIVDFAMIYFVGSIIDPLNLTPDEASRYEARIRPQAEADVRRLVIHLAGLDADATDATVVDQPTLVRIMQGETP